MGTYLRSRPSACVLALVPASHQLLMPATNVDGISLVGGGALSEGAREGAIEWAIVAIVADMRRRDTARVSVRSAILR